LAVLRFTAPLELDCQRHGGDIEAPRGDIDLQVEISPHGLRKA
jgi:hypothetical protein